MPQKIIYLTRHGETEYNRTGKLQGRGINAPLNEMGERQAEALADYFRDVELSAIHSSSLLRAEQTAGYVAHSRQLEVSKHSELDEMDFGIFEGRPGKEVSQQLKELHKRWKGGEIGLKVEGGESPEEVFARADRKMRSLLDSEGLPLFVLHGRLIRVLLSKWLMNGLHEMHKVKHSNCAIYKLEFENNRFFAHFMNEISHLTHLTDRVSV